MTVESLLGQISVRQITQENTGKNTAGVDKEVINTPQQRVKLVNKWMMPKVIPTKRVFSPKSNGKKRPLGIPTVRDRVAQNIVKNYLEPEWEAVFEPNSYGFRAGRSCHDAIAQSFIRLCKSRDTWVLDAEIKGCFDNLAHESILYTIGSVPRLELIEKWMKAGYVYKGIRHETNAGTPQGGVISPLLSNIGLHGLEQLIKSHSSKIGVFRYADDFIITATRKEEIEGRTGNSTLLTLFNITKHPIVRHIKVKGNASPFDAKLANYWEERSKKLGKSRWAKGSKYYKVADCQSWKCPICGQALLNGESIETHHIVPVIKGGSDDTENLIHLHSACHKQVHSKTK